MSKQRSHHPRWRITINRTDGNIEFDKIRFAHPEVRKIYNEMKKSGQISGVKDLNLVLIEYVLRRDKEAKIKNEIEKIILEPEQA